jgi:hypothetical protein
MKMNMVDDAEAQALSARNGTKTRPKWPILLLLLLSVTIGAGGCTDYDGTYTGYGPAYVGNGPYGPGYAGIGPYGPGFNRPYYGRGYAGYPGYGYPGSVTVAIGDRPYYTRGAGYYVGRSHYAWRPGHWGWRHGQRVWIRGRYGLRG